MGDDSFLGTTRGRITAGLILLVLIGLGLFVWQTVSASRALLDARERADRVQTLIKAGDFDGAARELQRLRKSTEQAHDSTDGILWDTGRHIPYLGRNIGAVQTVSEVLDSATEDNAPVALELSRAVDEGRFRPVDGRIDLAAVKELTPQVSRAARSIDAAAAELDDIHPDRLVFPFNDLVGDLQEQVAKARSAADATASSFELMPQMLGEDGPRDYLLMIQNPAELRSTGGLPGSLAILHADKGRLTMGWQGSAGDVNRGGFGGPVVQLAKDTLQQYGLTPATDFRDLNFTPDFPEAAQIAKTMVERKEDVKLDGVVSIDPIALGYLMRGTGPVVVSNVTLRSSNVAAALLNQTYQALQDPIAQDDFFEDVARKVFDSVMSGQGDQQQAIKGLAEGAGQHRVLLWSADEKEQAAIAGTAVAGELTGPSKDVAEVGMYLNDSLAGKVDYYLQYRSAVSAVDCRNDDSQDLRVSVAFTSQVPQDFARLSPYIVGTGQFAPKGSITFNLRIYAPLGGEITGLKVNGETRSVTADRHEDRQVAILPISLEPGEELNLTADIRTGKGQDGAGIFNFTPGMVPAGNGVKITSAC